MRERRLLLAAAVVLVAARAPAGPAPDPPALSAARREARAVALKRVSSELICQCGCNMILSECSHQSCPFALPERVKILEQIDSGKSDREILAGYVQAYGRSILSAPPRDAGLLDRVAWLVPGFALVAGALLVAWLVRRFTRRPAAVAGGDGTFPAGEDPYLRRVEEELGAGGGPGGRA